MGERGEQSRTYIAIDLKSFYASVECIERGLNPLTTHLVVADTSRTDKTICLAVSPSLKAYGISGRARLFEAVQRVREVNAERKRELGGTAFQGKSCHSYELEMHPDWEVDFLKAPPRMALYIEYSTRIYSIYLKYLAEEDIHVYSVDEVFIDATPYLATYKLSAHDLAMKMILDVYQQTGITATAGIGTNLYLSKVAMDIVAKHIPADENGVRIAQLDEMSYREQLWDHRPLTSFWRVGRGIATQLARYGIDTMGKIARCSVHREELLYSLFGVNAELLIDHAWGWEPCTMDMIKAYRPATHSFSSSQVLSEPYTFAKARVVAHEMADAVALHLVEKQMVTNSLTLAVSFDAQSLSTPDIAAHYQGATAMDHYGRQVPKPVHTTVRLEEYTLSQSVISQAVLAAFDKIVPHYMLVRRLNISTLNVLPEDEAVTPFVPFELDMFTDYAALARQREERQHAFAKERRLQEVLLAIKHAFGKNAILKGLNFSEGATAKDRNNQIGGHRA